MKIWIVIEHIDRGSDEFRIQKVFDNIDKARKHIIEHYYNKGWCPIFSGDEDIHGFMPEELEYFQDGDEMEDSVTIEPAEVE